MKDKYSVFSEKRAIQGVEKEKISLTAEQLFSEGAEFVNVCMGNFLSLKREDVISKMSFNPKDQPGFDASGEISLKENKIELFRPFFMQKPTHGRSVDEIYSVDSVLRTIQILKWPAGEAIAIEQKRDGVTCISGFTKIWTKEGLKSAREIQEGDEVLTHMGRFRKVLTVMERDIEYGKDKVFRMKLQGGSEFKITGEHPILSKDGKWIEIKDFKGEKASRPKIKMSMQENIKEIEIEDDLGYSKRVIADNDFFYFLGFFIGDGNLGALGKNQNRISLYLSINDDRERILKILTEKLKIPRERISIYQKGQNMVHICWYDSILKEWLSRNFYEYNGKNFKKSIPDWFDGLNKEQFLSFVEGWEDSDTCVSSSQKLAGKIGMLCLKKNIFASITRAETSAQNGFRGMAYKVRIYKKEVEENNDFFFPKVWISEIEESMNWPKKVYNFEVEEDNSYVAEGIVLHNCQAHKKGNDVKIWTEQGTLLNLPEIEKEIAQHRDDFIVIGELELFLKGAHQPRAEAAGILNSDADKRNIRLTLYDKLYMNGDIHNEMFGGRRKKLEMMKESEHVKINQIEWNDHDSDHNWQEELKKQILKAARVPGSEGAMLKLATGRYDLDRKTTDQIKFKNEREIIARVFAVHVVRNPSGNQFYYDMVLDQEKLRR